MIGDLFGCIAENRLTIESGVGQLIERNGKNKINYELYLKVSH